MTCEIDLENPIGLGCALESFAESAEVEGIIKLLSDGEKNEIVLEGAVERFVTIVDYYQEQPHLLDKKIPHFFKILLQIGLDDNLPLVCQHHAFKFMFYLTKTRGYKSVLKLFPHEVSDLPLALLTLQKQDINDHDSWETRYILFIWLSVIVLIPFEMSRFDGFATQASGTSIAKQLLDAGIQYLSAADKTNEAAAYFLSQFVARPDIVRIHLSDLLQRLIEAVEDEFTNVVPNVFHVMSVLRCLTLIFKHGKREELIEYAPNVYHKIKAFNFENNTNVLYRKLSCKLYHRICLVHLKTKLASWRYQKGARSLAVTLTGNNKESSVSNESKSSTTDANVSQVISSGDNANENTGLNTGDDFNEDISEDVELVLGDLLSTSIRDPDTSVRWSAAKSIGRITARLPLELANEIIDTILGNFDVLENEHTWHGSCLALAELARRGLILPNRLPDLIPVLSKSLQYEEQRGFQSVGACVRDAACFLAWGLPRTFSKTVMLPYVEKIACDLILVVLFDRQVNCRRSASAAFQENVGRHGKIPHGIEILTIADYSAVGKRPDCYVKLSVEVASYAVYEKSVIDHVARVRVTHWDEAIRILAAEALSNLCTINPQYIYEHILPQIIKNMTRSELNFRHGSVKSAGSILLSLYKLGFKINNLSDHLKSAVIGLVTFLEDNQFLKGFGGETIKPVVCEFIGKLCQTEFYDRNDESLKQTLFNFLIGCIKQVKEDIPLASAEAMYHFAQYFCPSNQTTLAKEIVKVLLQGLNSNDGTERSGFALLAGHFPNAFYTMDVLQQLSEILLKLMLTTQNNAEYAKARKNTLASLTAIYALKCNNNERQSVEKLISNVFEATALGLKDYSVNKRGDIGAETRESAMQSFASCMCETAKSDNQSLLPLKLINECLCLIMTQVSSRNNSVREEGFKCLTILYNHKLLRHFKDGQRLEEYIGAFASLPEEERENYCSIKMLRFIYPILHLDPYTYNILIGLTSCLGGLSESFSGETLAAFNSYVQMISEDPQKCNFFMNSYLEVFENNRGNDRIIIPFLEGTSLLLQAGVFDTLHSSDENFAVRLISFLDEEKKNCGAYHKLVLIVNNFSALLLSSNSSVHETCLKKLLVFLGHKFPRLRKHTASQLFENILICPELTLHLEDEAQEKIQNILSDFDWQMDDLKSAREARNRISEILGFPPPSMPNKLTTE